MHTQTNEAVIKKGLTFFLLLTSLVLAGAIWFFQTQHSNTKPGYTEPWRSSVWNNALCNFFTENSDKRDVALLNEALTNALGDKEPVFDEEAVAKEIVAKESTAEPTNITEQACAAVTSSSASLSASSSPNLPSGLPSNLSSSLSGRERRLLETLQAVTVLPSPPSNTMSADVLTLTSFIEQYGPLARADMRIYEVDVANQLFAYELRFEDARAYVMYNFSFDTHPMPLPLGFMASTKVTLYRTDNPEFKRFVTNGPLSITYHSAVVVIVD
ncbi:hypothetical protein CW735_00545 [Alteromonas sp. MB-3u-76]|uniref:hypothetical protein n=1 Tax=Alteromonas sp. MB-3u-76 TaxID=2058133 RepID=UPI000C30A48F|nr:hypothetical protein [Alteromonas sp. MB-3u-76]AUC86856.1 hypothetical protein CW735_00545 [Alteromonas sp. MB-3u-76]